MNWFGYFVATEYTAVASVSAESKSTAVWNRPALLGEACLSSGACSRMSSGVVPRPSTATGPSWLSSSRVTPSR